MKKDKNGYYRETFSYEGKQYSVRSKDKKEVLRKLAEKKRMVESGQVVMNNNTTVETWAIEWLETYKKGSCGLSQYKIYEGNIKKYIVPAIGSLRLKSVKPINLQKILNEQTGMSYSHVTKIKFLLYQMFDRARKNKLILDNPAEDLELPKSKEGQRRAITETERKYILQVAETNYFGLWVKTMLYCGLRPQETVTLQWKDIDFKNKILKVTSAMEARTGEEKTTKSKAGLRQIPIPDCLLEDLAKVKGNPFEYVFTQRLAGKRHTAMTIRGAWKSFKTDLDIAMGAEVQDRKVKAGKGYRNVKEITIHAVADDLVPYCLRHTYCTDLQAAGVPINVAKELMGHSDISVTARIYTHQSKTAFDNAADAINKHLSKHSKNDDKERAN